MGLKWHNPRGRRAAAWGGRALALAWLLLLAAGPAGAVGRLDLAQPDAARFPQVRLFAYPATNGRALAGLRPDQFRITEDGKPAEILEVTGNAPAPLALCLAVDRSASMQMADKLPAAQHAARQFLSRLRPSDRAAVVSFSNLCTLDAPLTDNRAALHRAIDRLQPYGETSLYDAVYWAINQVSLRPQPVGNLLAAQPASPDARRVVLVLTDGQDNASRTPAPEVVSMARANGISIYVVGLGRDVDRRQLDYLTQGTGGQTFLAPSPQDLARLYEQMSEQLRREFRVTYRTPRPEADASRRRVTLTIEGSGLPAAEGWYQAPGQGSMLVTATPLPGGGAAVTTGSPAGKEGLSLWLVLAGVLMLVIVGSLTLGWWLSRRRNSIPVGVATGPSIDLLPLWVRAPSTRVGRDYDMDLVVNSPLVSRLHARIDVDGEQYRLVDEGSSNGTYVNGRRVRRSILLRIGDTIRFGDVEYRFAGQAPADGSWPW